MPTTLLISLIIVIAFGGEALFGFGGGLVAVPLLSLFLDVHDAVVLVAIFQFLLGFIVLRNFREVAWSLLPPLLVGMVLGVLIGVKILPIVSEQLLRVLLAAYILAFLVKTKLAPELAVTRASWTGGIFSGVVSGFLQGCLGIGGPAMVIYLKGILSNARVFRASVIFCLSIVNLMRIPLVGYAELLAPPIIRTALIALPAFLIAVFLGQRYHRRIPEQMYFRVIYTLLAVTAVSLIIRAVA